MTADDLFRFVREMEQRLSKAELGKFRRRMRMKLQEEDERHQRRGPGGCTVKNHKHNNTRT